MNQKRIKGFTLIELLAVIVILAIIALIAVPVILNIIDKANKSAFKDTAYGVLSAGELYFSEQLLEVNGMSEEKRFKFPEDAEKLPIKGQVPTGGEMIVNTEGKVSLAVTNGRYCITKGFDDVDVTITEDITNCVVSDGNQGIGGTTGIALGQPVYFNMFQNAICTDYVEANSATNVLDDRCMRWYIYKIDGDNVGLILDHNGIATEAWQSGLPLITIQDLINMLPWYQNLEDKSNWEEDYSTYVVSAINDMNANVVESNYATKKAYYQAKIDYLNTNYSDIMLPSYMYEDILANNYVDGEDLITYGYWTSDVNTSTPNLAWNVNYYGVPFYYYTGDDSQHGLRPVITLSKSIIQ